MTTKLADRTVLDTNVLLAATDEGRAEHEAALAILDEWPAQGATFYTSAGRSCASTSPSRLVRLEYNGLGMSQPDAVGNARSIRQRCRMLDETSKVSDRLLELLDQTVRTGEQVHDANIVATVLTHGIEAIVTINTDDFARFGDWVEVIGLPLGGRR